MVVDVWVVVLLAVCIMVDGTVLLWVGVELLGEYGVLSLFWLCVGS